MKGARSIDLGETWQEAIESAYIAGYRRFNFGAQKVKQRARAVAEEHGESDAVSYLINDAKFDTILREGIEYKRFWWAVEDFYEKHRSDEEEKRFNREAAVAEDLVSAYEAGAHDAILGNEIDRSTVEHVHATSAAG